MKRALLYHNPAAGRAPVTSERREQLLGYFRSLGYDAASQTSNSADRVSSELDLEGVDLLVIQGGDGTIRSLLPSVVRSRVPVALIPSGTANVLARELGIPLRTKQALEVIAEGKRRTIYLGESQGRYFHLMAGIGLDSHVIRRTGERLKKMLGIGAFWLAGIRSYRTFPLMPFEVILDGVLQEATFAVISNSRFYGGHLMIAPRASVFEECLDVCLFKSTVRSRFIKYLAAALRGRHLDFPDVVYQKVQSVQVRGEEEIEVQMDGDIVGCLPMDFNVCPRGIEILVP